MRLHGVDKEKFTFTLTFGNQPELIPEWLLRNISNIQHLRQEKLSYWLTVSLFRSIYLHFPNQRTSPYFRAVV